MATIAGWNWLLDMAAYRFPTLRGLLEAMPLPLVVNGKPVRRNLRREMISMDELMGKLREHGIEKLQEVKAATMESDGEISVIKHDGEPEPPTPKGGKPAG